MKTEDKIFGCTHMMNIYRGCSHGCIYCDSRSECYQNSRPPGDFSIIHAKENALVLIEKELKTRHAGKKMIIGTGSMSDPYNPYERKTKFTKNALMLFDKYKCGTGLITKSDLIVRDAEILSKIQTHSPVNAGITITAADDNVCKKIEPYASLSSERFKAVKKLAKAGVFAGVHMNPILPKITDSEENIKAVIEKSAASDAKYVLCYGFGMTLRNGNREYYYEKLDFHYPTLKEKYIQRYGDRYFCSCEKATSLFHLFKEECQKYGLLYKSEDILKARQKQKNEQKTIFDFE